MGDYFSEELDVLKRNIFNFNPCRGKLKPSQKHSFKIGAIEFSRNSFVMNNNT